MLCEWCYSDGYFSENECDRILELSKNYTLQKGTISTTDGFLFVNNSRRSNIYFITKDNSDYTWVFDKLWKITNLCNQRYFNFDISSLDYIQFTEYDSADLGEYTRHLDTIWCNTDHPRHRKLSCTVQLSSPDDYSGGDFLFHDLQKESPNEHKLKIMRNRGTIILFPSFIYHSVAPVTAGKRYSLTAWFEGPKWK